MYATNVLFFVPCFKEIPDFLTEDECNFIMKQAVKQGLKSSIAKGGLSPKLMPILPENGKLSFPSLLLLVSVTLFLVNGRLSLPVTGKLPPNEIGGRFENWDQNNDDVIDILEVRLAL